MLRRLFTFIPILLLLGASLLLFFINLTGASNKSVLSRFYWSETETKGISGADFSKTRWTNYGICDGSSGKNTDCTKHKPAYPYSPKDNFKSSSGLPSSFTKDRDTYYYLTRFAYAFFLIGLVFSLFALIPVLLTCCGTGFFTGIFSTLAIAMASLFTITAACLVTAAHVKGRNAFKDSGHKSSLGVKLFGITWAAVACLLLSFIWSIAVTCLGAKSRVGKRKDKTESDYDQKSLSSSSSYHYNGTVQSPYDQNTTTGTTPHDGTYIPNGNVADQQLQQQQQEAPATSKFSFFRVKRNTPIEDDL